MTNKQYTIINNEPNCNILGLHPIIRAFFHPEMQKLTGRILQGFAYKVEDEVMVAIAIKEDWFGFGEYLFKKMNEDQNFYNKVKNHLLDNGGKLYDYCQHKLTDFKHGQLTEAQMKESIVEIFEMFTLICVAGLVAPLVEMGGGGMSNKIAEIIKDKDLNNVGLSASECLTILTTPRINTWTEDLKTELYLVADWLFEHQENLNDLSAEGEAVIARVVEKFGWVFYGYKGPEYTINNAKEEIVHILSQAISPKEQLENTRDNFKKLLVSQKEIMNKLKFSDEEKYFVATAQDFGYTKAYRANLMSLANFTVNKLLNIFAKKDGYSIKQLGLCTVEEITNYLKDEASSPSVDLLNERAKYALLLSYPDSDKILVADVAKRWIEDNVEVEQIDFDQTEFSGTVACAGGVKKIQGTVKIVMSNNDISKVEAGDILVSSNTTPDHVPAMRRSVAIVTQIGGLTCHAAIVSRELNKPCLVGVKGLLQIFKDGDKVEVNLENAVIKKL